MGRPKKLHSRDPGDYSDLGPVIPAGKAAQSRPVPEPEPEVPEPLKRPEEPRISLRAEDVVSAINSGDSTGLPLRKGFDPFQSGNEVVLSSESSKLTAAIAGHAVECEIISELRLVRWNVKGKAEDLSGKYRLVNDTRMAIGGQVVTLRAGKEFFGHQIDPESVKQSGGIVLPIGTQE